MHMPIVALLTWPANGALLNYRESFQMNEISSDIISSRGSGSTSENACAEDGSPVHFYQNAGDIGEAAFIHRHIPSKSDILDLGSGTGRIAHALERLGHRVTAVDSSHAMLSFVRSFRAHQSQIEDFRIEERFDAVLLASNLLSDESMTRRRAMLATCRHHLKAGGVLLVQVHDFRNVSNGFIGEMSGFRISLTNVRHDEPRFHAKLVYEKDGVSCDHAFSCVNLSLEEIESDLHSQNLAFEAWIDPITHWFLARPSGQLGISGAPAR